MITIIPPGCLRFLNVYIYRLTFCVNPISTIQSHRAYSSLFWVVSCICFISIIMELSTATQLLAHHADLKSWTQTFMFETPSVYVNLATAIGPGARTLDNATNQPENFPKFKSCRSNTFFVLILILTVVWSAQTVFSMTYALGYPEHPTSRII